MKKVISLFALFSFWFLTADCQVTQGNWMVGGNGRFSFETKKSSLIGGKSKLLAIRPNAGYFFADRFAAGLNAPIEYSSITSGGTTAKSSKYGIGPFARFYFLPVDNRINLLTQGAYMHVFTRSSGNTINNDEFTLSAGPVLFFTENVGIELTANYDWYGQSNANYSISTIYFNIGFQIHLQRID